MTGKRQNSCEESKNSIINVPMETEDRVDNKIMMFERKNEQSFDIPDDSDTQTTLIEQLPPPDIANISAVINDNKFMQTTYNF